jgi:hypothetical protein
MILGGGWHAFAMWLNIAWAGSGSNTPLASAWGRCISTVHQTSGAAQLGLAFRTMENPL